MIKTTVTTFIFILLSFALFEAKANSDIRKLRFCYENQEVFPHYLTSDSDVPLHRPGAVIEVMQELDRKLPHTDIEFVRAPWKRCLNELKLNKVDAVIGRYTQERSEFAIYPRIDNGIIDTTKAFSVTSSCFIHDISLPLKWDGTTLGIEQPQGLIAPMGYSVVEDLKQLGFDVYEASSIELAHKLLFNGKFKVSLSDCNLKQHPSFIVENRTPVSRVYGYLMFSKKYYWDNTDKSEFIWRALLGVDKNSIYKKYK